MSVVKHQTRWSVVLGFIMWGLIISVFVVKELRASQRQGVSVGVVNDH